MVGSTRRRMVRTSKIYSESEALLNRDRDGRVRASSRIKRVVPYHRHDRNVHGRHHTSRYRISYFHHSLTLT